MKFKLFNTKEQYLTFRTAWKAAFKSVHNKPTKDATYGNKVQGWLTSSHVIAHNLLRDKPVHHGFSPVLNQNKLINGTLINQAFYFGFCNLVAVISSAEHLVQEKARTGVMPTDYNRRRVDTFLAPFGGTLTCDILAGMKPFLPKVQPLYGTSDFGKQFVQSVRAKAAVPVTDYAISPMVAMA